MEAETDFYEWITAANSRVIFFLVKYKFYCKINFNNIIYFIEWYFFRLLY